MDSETWSAPFKIEDRKKLPCVKGVYLFKVISNDAEVIKYIGRSKNIQQRIQGHLPLLRIIEGGLSVGETLQIFYYQTTDYAEVEEKLIDRYRPKHNSHFNLSRRPLRYYASIYK